MSPGTVVDLKYRMIDFFVHYFISLYFLVDISYFDAILYLFGIILLLSSNTVCSHFRIAATSLSVWSQCCPFSTKFSRQLFSSENLFTILYGIISSWVPYKIFVSLQIDFTGCSRTQHKYFQDKTTPVSVLISWLSFNCSSVTCACNIILEIISSISKLYHESPDGNLRFELSGNSG